MSFAHDTTLALQVAAALVNSQLNRAVGSGDALTTLADLDDLLARFPYSGVIRRDDRELAEIRQIRPRLEQLWHVDRDGAVALVNTMLADGDAMPQLVSHEGLTQWHIHATRDDAPLATRMLVECAMAFVDIIRADAYARVRTCDADDCEAVFIDFSRNRSKRYCDVGNCGNRMNVNAYRRRKAGEETP